MSKSIAVVQSSYIPWKGYFDMINLVDEFILYDDVQYSRGSWRNRNQIKSQAGLLWLTIPIMGKFPYKVNEARVSQPGWNAKHWQTLQHTYKRAKHFATYHDQLKALYLDCEESYLSALNYRFLCALCALLGIPTKLSWSMDYPLVGDRNERLVSLCQQTNATTYLTGPTAREYLNEELFVEAGISVRYMDYDGYPEYPQLFPPFTHYVSILDLLFSVGPDAPRYMKSFA